MQPVPKWWQRFRPQELGDAVTMLPVLAGANFDSYKCVHVKEEPENVAIINKETNAALDKELSLFMDKIQFLQG